MSDPTLTAAPSPSEVGTPPAPDGGASSPDPSTPATPDGGSEDAAALREQLRHAVLCTLTTRAFDRDVTQGEVYALDSAEEKARYLAFRQQVMGELVAAFSDAELAGTVAEVDAQAEAAAAAAAAAAVPPPPPPAPPVGTLSEDTPFEEVRKLAKERGISTKGMSKAELLAALAQYDATHGGSAAPPAPPTP